MVEQIWFDLFLRDRRAVVAIAIVAASFLPLTNAGSLIDVQQEVSAATQALNMMGGMLTSSGSSSAGLMTGGLNLLFVLYLVPVLAIVVIALALGSRDTRSWGALSGIAAVALPLIIPFIAGELVLSGLPPEFRLMVGQQGGPNFTSFGVGVWALVLLGITQLYFSFRRG